MERLSQEEVVQVVDGRHTARLIKERWRVKGDIPLALVRKHRPGGPTGPALLLVHGFAQNRYTWHTAMRSLSAWLADQGFDVWNLELRGHGNSRLEGQKGAEQFADYVEDVLRAAAALPEPAFWIGHSLGGAALYGAAVTAAERDLPMPRGIIGIAALYHFGQANRFLGLLGRITWALRDEPVMHRFQIRTKVLGRILARLYGLSDVLGYTAPASGWWPGSIEPELLQWRLRNGFDWTSVKVWQEMARWASTREFEYDTGWRKLDLPLLVILGDRDHLCPPGDGEVAFERSASTDKEMVVFDDWHHQVHWGHLDLLMGIRAPAHVWPLLERWLRERA